VTKAQDVRLLILVPRFHPHIGGSETVTRDLGGKLREWGIEVTVVTRRIAAGLPRRELIGNIPIVRLGPVGFSRRGEHLFYLNALAYLLCHRREYDVVHVYASGYLVAFSCALGHLLGKAVTTKPPNPNEVRGFVRGSLGGTVGRLLIPPWLRLRLYRGLDGLVAQNIEIGEELLSLGIERSRIWFILGGVDTRAFHPPQPGQKEALRRRLALPEQGMIFTFSGRFVPIKGLMGLLAAWKEVSKAEPGAYLLLLGSDPDPSQAFLGGMQDFITSHSLSGSILMPGWVENPSLYLRASDVFVLPSDSEGLPLALLEAMATGLPIIASRVGGIPEAIEEGENGLLCPAGKPEELARLMMLVAADPSLRQRLGRAARRRALENHSLDAVASRYLDFFREACK